ncbi:MAG: Hsp33 family molecular chaperone HslO, partial [Acutalibacteraceae bacterium]
GRDELEKLKEDEKTEVCCQFCDKKYEFSPADINRLIEESSKKQ